jgi:hypothetical protein
MSAQLHAIPALSRVWSMQLIPIGCMRDPPRGSRSTSTSCGYPGLVQPPQHKVPARNDPEQATGQRAPPAVANCHHRSRDRRQRQNPRTRAPWLLSANCRSAASSRPSRRYGACWLRLLRAGPSLLRRLKTFVGGLSKATPLSFLASGGLEPGLRSSGWGPATPPRFRQAADWLCRGYAVDGPVKH